MYEDAVASAVQAAMEAALSSANTSRPFMVQTLLPSAAPPHVVAGARDAAVPNKGASSGSIGLIKNTPGYPKDTVRADHTLQQGQLEAFLTRIDAGGKSGGDSKRLKGDAIQAAAHIQGGWTRGQASTTAGWLLSPCVYIINLSSFRRPTQPAAGMRHQPCQCTRHARQHTISCTPRSV
jgi:hypothetical protein